VLNLNWKANRLRADQRVVTKIPLTELWDESGTITSERIRSLDQSTLLELVRSVSVQFVVADCGLKLDWIPREKRFDFWKTVRPQIADPAKPIFLGSFRNETAYIASEWRGRTGECLVLLERHH
jgi:hypothetical protein